MRDANDLLDDDPITLSEASKVVLRGIVPVSALRTEIARGNLVAAKIGKNLVTTPAAIREMRERCRVQPNRHASISEETRDDPSGSSATETVIDARAAMRATVQALKDGSLSTSRKSTPRGQREAANPIPFPSRK